MSHEPRARYARIAYWRRRLLNLAFLPAFRPIFLMVIAAVSFQLGDSAWAQLDAQQPQVGPGVPQVGSSAPRSSASSSKAGSVLFFHKYTSDTTRPNEINTLITLTNTNPRDAVIARVFFIHDGVFEDRFIALVANQSRTLVAGSESPNKTGYVMAVAVNSQGLPAQFNWLIGGASLRDGQGHEASYNAFAVAKRSAGPINFNDGGQSSTVRFDNTAYDRLPMVVAADSLRNQDPALGSAVTTSFALYSPMADLTGAAAAAYTLAATAFDDLGQSFTQEISVQHAINRNVSQIWTDRPFNTIISGDRLGWARFSTRRRESDAPDAPPVPLPVLGLSLTDGANEPMHNARIMQTMEWLDSFSITIPARLPDNPITDVVTSEQPAATNGAQGASETKAGSVLLFPRFVSGANGDSQIYLTNTHPTQRVRLRVFFTGLADPAEVKESIISLDALRTTVLEADSQVPDQRGWVLVTAIDNRTLPFQFNHLIGSAQVNEAGGQKTSFNAIAFAKNTPGAVDRNQDVTTATLQFNDEIFDRWPATTALSFVTSQYDNGSTLGFSRPANSLLDPPNTRGSLTVTLYDQLLAVFSATAARNENKLNQLRPSILQPPITNTILPGQRGWLKILSGTPVLSWSENVAAAPFTASGGIWVGGLNGGGNLYALTTADEFTLKVSATIPNNRAPFAVAESLGLRIEARRGEGTIVRLDGSGSGDVDPEDSLTYAWTDNDSPVSTLRIDDYKLGLGTHTIKLVVTDSSGAPSAPAEQTVTVVDTTAPIISGVPSAIGKITDSDSGEAINFLLPIAYDMVDGPINVTASTASGSIFPLGKTVVTFTALDRAGNTSQATMEVTLTKGSPEPPTGGVPGDKAPVMDNINDQYVKIGEFRSVTFQASDDDGDPVMFSLLGAPPYALIIGGDPGARRATLLIAPKQGDQVASGNVRVVLNDGRGRTFTTLPFRIIISNTPNQEPGVNRPPVPIIAPLPATIQATTKAGAEVTLDGSRSSDPDGDALDYMWFDGNTLISTEPIVTVKLAAGTHSIKLVVADSRDGMAMSDPVAIEVLPRPLSVISASPRLLRINTTATLSVSGTGFAPGAILLFSKEGISITNYTSIEEDTIVAEIAVSPTAVQGFYDVFVVNPNGRFVRLRSGLIVIR
ncbi:MAG TPA: HYR domain-containing protein [Blastocatellia bacterium]|nr:HYR domain-containing protein [Blastocatellia bacterium]